MRKAQKAKQDEFYTQLVDIENEVVYRLGKWSSTTSKQTTQFCNQYYRYYEQVQF